MPTIVLDLWRIETKSKTTFSFKQCKYSQKTNLENKKQKYAVHVLTDSQKALFS